MQNLKLTCLGNRKQVVEVGKTFANFRYLTFHADFRSDKTENELSASYVLVTIFLMNWC